GIEGAAVWRIKSERGNGPRPEYTYGLRKTTSLLSSKPVVCLLTSVSGCPPMSAYPQAAVYISRGWTILRVNLSRPNACDSSHPGLYAESVSICRTSISHNGGALQELARKQTRCLINYLVVRNIIL